MAREIFKNLPDTTTPLTAPRLNGLLDGDEPMGNVVVDSIRSKNVFDKNNTYIGYFYSDGSIGNNIDYCYSDYIPVDGFGKITISGVSTIGNAHMIEYNSNKEYVDFWQTKNNTVTLNNNTKYVRISTPNVNKNTFQAEKGDTATTYSEYQDLNTTRLNNLFSTETKTTTGVVMTSGNYYTGNISYTPPSGYEVISIIPMNMTFGDANFIRFNYVSSAAKIYYRIDCGYNNGSSITCQLKVVCKKTN